MKKMIMIVVAVLSVFAATAQIKSAELTASGLTCSMCSKAIYESLKKVDFVKEVKANIKNSTYTIEFKEGANVDPDVLSKSVTDAGFSVAKLQMTVHFDKTAVKNDEHVQVGGKTYHFLKVTNQELNGDKQVTLLDKKFLSAKDFKKYSTLTKMKCFETGVAESCCTNTSQGQRVYHVTI